MYCNYGRIWPISCFLMTCLPDTRIGRTSVLYYMQQTNQKFSSAFGISVHFYQNWTSTFTVIFLCFFPFFTFLGTSVYHYSIWMLIPLLKGIKNVKWSRRIFEYPPLYVAKASNNSIFTLFSNNTPNKFHNCYISSFYPKRHIFTYLKSPSMAIIAIKIKIFVHFFFQIFM